ncbi:MAG: LLM class flavin-dependent oxidoreductase, partial [Nocardioidaceae bacterium]
MGVVLVDLPSDDALRELIGRDLLASADLEQVALACLADVGGLTERVELGTTVTVLPYRNPLLTARVVANIDQFSGGRFIFGVGVGWSKQEYAALGSRSSAETRSPTTTSQRSQRCGRRTSRPMTARSLRFATCVQHPERLGAP